MVSAAVLGRWGEDLAARHLEEDGFVLLARNWRCELGELDLIGRGADLLVVCEVKTRRGVRFGSPADAVTAAKARRLRRLAGRWLAQHRPGVAAVRIDVITVLLRGDGVQLDHLPGVC
ncbi:MAG TPA: YraN family protein [Mycobacteriales bacterium]|nr:YraN family protein [Mycobacteriales bacterium]